MQRLFVNDALSGKTGVFTDRVHAGRVLAEMLRPRLADLKEAVVLAIPAGGVPVGLALARALGLPFDLVFVRKLHFPDNPEAGFGALSEHGAMELNPDYLPFFTPGEIARQAEVERRALLARVERLRRVWPARDLRGKTAILVDDGLASGYTMRVAIEEARRQGARRVIVAVPTASLTAVKRVLPLADRVYVANLRTGPEFAVADAYRNWRDLSLDEVEALLLAAKEAEQKEQRDPHHHAGVGEVEDRP